MFRNYYNEEWKEIEREDYAPKKSRVFISNYGRVKKKSSGKEDFKLTKWTIVNGFASSSYPRKDKPTQGRFYIHKMVATCFLETPQEDKKFVIHLDHDLLNNEVSNLKFANKKERSVHLWTNPKYLESRKNWRPNPKLSEPKVKLLKKKLADPNRKTKLKIIAKQFNISLSHLKSIKNGEYWKDVEV